MNTQIEHAHMNIKTCIERDQNKYECVPGQRVIMRYQERGVSAQLKNNLMHVIEQNKSIIYDNQVNQISYVEPPPKPVLSCLNQFR